MNAAGSPRKGAWRLLAGWPRRRAADPRRTINLALQGGGADGAFTWGVIDRLLEDGRFRFDTVSGTSAGGINGVALAAGLTEGGSDAARGLLESVWRDIAGTARSAGGTGLWPFSRAQQGVQQLTLGLFTRLFSPYQFNPLDLNPLRAILADRIDFERLRDGSPVSLLIAATDVETGRAALFRNGEITVEVLLASCCLPQLFQAVRIDDRNYWDGGYSANPPVLPLIQAAASEDTLIVQIAREVQTGLPRGAPDIMDRLQHMAFNQPLRMEIDLIAQARRLAREGFSFGGRERRRLKRHRLHRIAATDAGGGQLTPEWGALQKLRDQGREAAAQWVSAHYNQIGRRSTVDLSVGVT